jgi:hypothetical protein
MPRTRTRTGADDIPVEAFLEAYPPPMIEIAERLRAIVRAASPEASERIRLGWRLLAYDLPIKRTGAFFAWVGPEAKHVHLGFPKGVLMADPRGLLKGAGITKYARWFTFVPGDPIDAEVLAEYVREAARVAVIPKSVGANAQRPTTD